MDSILTGLDVDVEELDRTDDDGVSLKAMSSEERRLVIQRDHPELLPLLKEMREKAEDISSRVSPILERVELREMLTAEVCHDSKNILN